MRRLKRTLVASSLARNYAFEAANRASDFAQLSGNCMKPVHVPLTGLRDQRLARLEALRTDGSSVDYAPGYGWIGNVEDQFMQLQHVDLAVRCRRCAACLRERSQMWAVRAKSEITASDRTWFGTLTLRPEEWVMCQFRADARLARGAVDIQSQRPEYRWRYEVAEFQYLITKYLKRVRKSVGRFRYLLVIEKHKSGVPHAHLLVHQIANPITYRFLSGNWVHGFSQFKLVDENHNAAAWYICKYLAKDMLARVRASRQYGDILPEAKARIVQAGLE